MTSRYDFFCLKESFVNNALFSQCLQIGDIYFEISFLEMLILLFLLLRVFPMKHALIL